MTNQPIGIFDSGVGGLSVQLAVREVMPSESILYFADQAHVPYGVRTRAQIEEFSKAISSFLLALDAKLIIVACNTASAAALDSLRLRFPEVPFVGMEPAVKPAAENSQTRTVGVLATPATFQGDMFSDVVRKFADGVVVLEETLPGLVELIESGQTRGPKVSNILQRGIKPLLEQGADTLVLGCTHYAFVLPAIRALVPPSVSVIDPAPAVARQTRRMLRQNSLASTYAGQPSLSYHTTGDRTSLDRFAAEVLGDAIRSRAVHWHDEKVLPEEIPHSDNR